MNTNLARSLSCIVIVSFALVTLLTACEKKAKRSKFKVVKVEKIPSKAPLKRKPRVPEQIKKDKNSLLGGERGLDHVGIAVRELDAAGKHYAGKLGFGNPQPGKLPNGLSNINFYFGDTTYLELLNAYDAKKNPWVSGFLNKYESGALFAVLTTYAYGLSAAFLHRAGHPVGKPLPGRIEAKGVKRSKRPLWHTFYFKPWALPGNVNNLYFITYYRGMRNAILAKLKDDVLRRKTFVHANTALGVSATWMAVKNLKSAQKAYAAIGLDQAHKVIMDKRFAAKALAVKAGEGHLLLLQPKRSGKGPVAHFIKRRGEGIVGLSVRVEKLETAHEVVQKGLGEKLALHPGAFGKAFVLPPEKTYGVWLEFVQSKTDK
ncbi:MAG: VOC family protein [Deltaproteobacteria bacterium]|nr:VOC family protein [Deltaproteobacteria bacterium]